jgi:transposase
MRHIGLDVHKQSSKLCWIDEATGEVSGRRTVPTAQVVRVVNSLPGERCVVLETGSQSWFLGRALLSLPQTQVFVVDAFKAHRGLEGMHPGKKTDQWDAYGLAKLSWENRAAPMAVWLADLKTHELRTVSRTRLALVQQATALQNQLRALLHAEGLDCQSSDLMGQKAQGELEALAQLLSPICAECFSHLRQSLVFLKQRIQTLEKRLLRLATDDARCRRLMTLPGCGVILASLLVAEIGPLNRFSEAKYLRSYAGLTPSISQSGERSFVGPLTRGNCCLKYALVLLAQHFAWSQDFGETRLKRAYYRCLNRHGPNPAKVALARHLCDVIFAMLRDEKDFEPARLTA